MKVLRTVQYGLVAAAVVVALAGCSSDDNNVNLSGARGLELEASSCADLAGSGALRPDTGIPTLIRVRVFSAEQRIDGDIYYDISGITEVFGGTLTTYDWTCVSHYPLDGRSMDSKVLTFEPQSP